MLLLITTTICEARTNNYCRYNYLGVNVYGGRQVDCGGELPRAVQAAGGL